MSASFEIQLIAVLVAMSSALVGVFLVLRSMAMMSDAITHTILLGIVLAFFVTHDLNSPFLIVGAALVGVITVWLTEMLTKTRLVSEDSAIGIVFPFLFAIAIILISRYGGSVHLDTDSVLLGELAFAPFDRLVVFGVDIGARSIYTTGVSLLINVLFITIFFKELKISSFDPLLAAVLGFSPVIIHYALMTLVSLTAVVAFEAVGSILVVSFMIGPPVMAYLLTDDLKRMILLSALFGALSGIIGYQIAAILDVSIAGSMAMTVGILFTLVFIFAPKRGLISIQNRKKTQKKEFIGHTLLMHVCNHEELGDAHLENSLDTITEHLKWDANKLNTVLTPLLDNEQIVIKDNILTSTAKGRKSNELFMEDL